MGIRDFFVEKIPEENHVLDEDYSVEEVEQSAELDEVRTDTLIDDIYVQNELNDKSKSIFKIEDLINSLPKEMVTETKKTSVLATLGVFGLTVTDVTLDGENRVNVLHSVLSKILTDGNETVTEKENKIEELKKEIASLEKEIVEQQTVIKESENTINAEIERITGLIKFVDGGNS